MSSKAVAARLARMAELWEPLDREQARALLEARASSGDPLSAVAVQRRLDELRALCELTQYLHGRARPR